MRWGLSTTPNVVGCDWSVCVTWCKWRALIGWSRGCWRASPGGHNRNYIDEGLGLGWRSLAEGDVTTRLGRVGGWGGCVAALRSGVCDVGGCFLFLLLLEAAAL